MLGCGPNLLSSVVLGHGLADFSIATNRRSRHKVCRSQYAYSIATATKPRNVV